MHNLVAYFKGTTTSGAMNEQLPGVPDQSMPMDSNNRFIMPGPWRLLAYHAGGANIAGAQLNAPSLRGTFLPQIYPVTAGGAPGTIDAPTYLHGRGTILAPNEGLEVDASNDAGGTAASFAGIWLAPDMIAASPGPVYTMEATVTITTVVGAWVFGALAFLQTLPAGRYDVVGMAVVSANGVYARLVYPGVSNYRPGVLCQAALGDLPLDDYWRYGQMGSFGRFESTAVPQIEVMGDAAGSDAIRVWLDLVRVR